MKVNHVLILAAGKGTRMGEIGKEIPKVIWPLFNKGILDLEVSYAKKLAPEANIHINLYNYAEKIKNHISCEDLTFKNVNIIEETEVLDIGGAIHNLAEKLNYKGNLLILNSDQFLFCEKKIIDEGLKKLLENDSLLFGYEVNASDGYNALAIKNGKFIEVIPNSHLNKEEKIVTYTGMSLINLDKLNKVKGESKFFDSVANGKEYKVYVQKISDFEYWDFGTTKRYYSSLQLLLKNKDSKFFEFLKNEKVFENINLDTSIISFNDFEIGNGEIRYKKLVEKINL